MPKPDAELFKVVLEKTHDELPPMFITEATHRVEHCVLVLLEAAGYEGGLDLTVGKSERDWHITVSVDHRLHRKLDLFNSKDGTHPVAQVAGAVVDVALVALELTTKGLDLELSVQSDSGRSLALEPSLLEGVIIGVGCSDLFIVPFNKQGGRRLCLHAVRVKIPTSMQSQVLPQHVLEEYVLKKLRVALLLQAEQVSRARRQFTAVLVQWPPAKMEGGPASRGALR